MKKLISSSMLALSLVATSAPMIAHAQDDEVVTRAQVRAELAAVERAGYNPAYSHGPDYPSSLQAAEHKLAADTPFYAQSGVLSNGQGAPASR